jgi:hypothetical protein
MTFNRIKWQTCTSKLRFHRIATLSAPTVAHKNADRFLENDPRKEWLIAEVINPYAILSQVSRERTTLEKWNLYRMTSLGKPAFDGGDGISYIHDVTCLRFSRCLQRKLQCARQIEKAANVGISRRERSEAVGCMRC